MFLAASEGTETADIAPKQCKKSVDLNRFIGKIIQLGESVEISINLSLVVKKGRRTFLQKTYLFSVIVVVSLCRSPHFTVVDREF
jgi:hypothetical protein